MKIWSYPKVWNLGHPMIDGIFDEEVVVQEKVDGSQISFGLLGGELCMRSKNVEIDPDNPGMFDLAVEAINGLGKSLMPGWVYRGEYLRAPKHNTIKYSRIPTNHIVLFDIETEPGRFIDDFDVMLSEANRLGFEIATTFFEGVISGFDAIKPMLKFTSMLGASQIEGVVIKGYGRFCRDGKMMIGKYVSESFKESHKTAWKASNPSRNDILEMLSSALRSEARWRKAVYRLREQGKLEFSPRDIRMLIKEILNDAKDEEADRIKDMLFSWAWKKIGPSLTRGFPEWYKEKLAEGEFRT